MRLIIVGMWGSVDVAASNSLSRWSQNLPLANTLMGLIALAGTVGLSLLLHKYRYVCSAIKSASGQESEELSGILE
ncbi:hypothetical protein [Arthrobacter psychrolactophilus]